MARSKPNFVFIFADNLGYGDWGCFGSTLHKTPRTDRMAEEGLKLTSFYSTSGVCTPSRASVMTGCYPRRVGMHVSGAGTPVLRPRDSKGLNPNEITIASLLKTEGYATACIGKWHLGDQPPFLPTRHGFDYYVGIPYSDDMTHETNSDFPPIPLLCNEEVVEAPVDRDTLTRRYTEEALRFVENHRDEPFYLYLPHAMPGSTSRPFASPAFQGSSDNGPYGDSIEEMDWSTGQILDKLKALGLDEDTLVVTTSDNGAVRRNPIQGSNAPLRGWGYDTSEGGMRMPCVVRWPGRIAPGSVSDEITSTMDWYATFAALAGAEMPADRIVDGKDIRPLLFAEPDAVSGYDAGGFLYYYLGQLQAVRSERWKLYLPLEKKLVSLRGDVEAAAARLYDLRADIDETTDLAEAKPEVVARLRECAEKARADIGDVGRQGTGQRPAGWMDDPEPRLLARID